MQREKETHTRTNAVAIVALVLSLSRTGIVVPCCTERHLRMEGG